MLQRTEGYYAARSLCVTGTSQKFLFTKTKVSDARDSEKRFEIISD